MRESRHNSSIVEFSRNASLRSELNSPWLHQQAGQKTAPDQRVRTSNQLLQCGSHPQRTLATTPGSDIAPEAAQFEGEIEVDFPTP